jgi:hypothetical protein
VFFLLLLCLGAVAFTQSLTDAQKLDQAVSLAQSVVCESDTCKTRQKDVVTRLTNLKFYLPATTPVPPPPPPVYVTQSVFDALVARVAKLEGVTTPTPVPTPEPTPVPTPTPTPTPIPLPPPSTDGHGYFDALSKRADVLASYSLRDPKQLARKVDGGFAHCGSCPLFVTYDPINDPDPRKQDAAKIVVGGNNLQNQVRFPIPATAGSLLLTWDAWFGKEWARSNTGLTSYKTWQIASPAETIWLETRNRWRETGSLYTVDTRFYGNSTMYGANVTDNDPLGPMAGAFAVQPETWVRYWVFLKPAGAFYEYSLWVADETREPVKVLDKLLVKLNSVGPRAFWIEYNTSTTEIIGTRPLVSYNRNLVMLAGLDDPTPLLQKPVK